MSDNKRNTDFTLTDKRKTNSDNRDIMKEINHTKQTKNKPVQNSKD